MSEWISVKDALPSEDGQVEVVFYVSPYVWETGLFTAKGFLGLSGSQFDNCFQRYVHDEDNDYYETVDDVTHWIELPEPQK